MKVEWVQGAHPNLHTQLHTQVLGILCGGGQGLPSTIVFLLGLSLPTCRRGMGGVFLPWGKGLTQSMERGKKTF